MKDLPASHPLYGSEQSKSGFGICYQFAIKCPVSVSKTQCFQGFAGFVSYSHSLNPENRKALIYQARPAFRSCVFRIMFRRIEAFLKFPKTNRNQVKLFFLVTSLFLCLCSWCRGRRLCEVALQSLISKCEVKRVKVKMPLKGSEMPYNRFYTPLRVEIPPKSKTPIKTPLNALCGILPFLGWRKRRRRLCVASFNQKENHPYSVLQE